MENYRIFSITEKMLFTCILMLCLLLGSRHLFGQERQIATFNGGGVTESELRNRLQFSPQVVDWTFGKDSAKLQLLSSLLAEKLWAKEAELYGFQNNPELTGYLRLLKKIYVRDALFKEQIEKNVVVTAADKDIAEQKNRHALSFLIISEKDSSSIAHDYELIRKNESKFDSLCLAQKDKTLSNVFVIHFGDLEKESIEDYLFAMSPDQISIPLNDGKAWHIFKLLHDDPYTPPAKDPLKIAKNRLRERRQKEFGEKYLAALLADAKIPFSEPAFTVLTRGIRALLIEKHNSQHPDSTVYFTEADCNKLKFRLGEDSLKISAVLFPQNPLTVRDVIDYFSFYGLVVNPENIPLLSGRLAKELRKITQDELIYREGLRLNLDASPEIATELAHWQQNALAQYIRNRCMDSVSVTDTELKEYYDKLHNSLEPVEKVQILVIAHTSIDTLKAIADSVAAKKPFDPYFDRLKQTKYITYSPMPLSYFADFGKLLDGKEPGDVVGPIKIDSLYYLGRLVKRLPADSLFIKPFEETKDQLRGVYKAKLLTLFYDKKTVALAEKYHVSIDYDAFTQLKYNDTPMFVYRFMGFGGPISAVPYTTPMYHWIKEYMTKHQQNP